jgi:hypothetical protein
MGRLLSACTAGAIKGQSTTNHATPIFFMVSFSQAMRQKIVVIVDWAIGSWHL